MKKSLNEKGQKEEINLPWRICPAEWDRYIVEGISDLHFLNMKEGAEKFLSVSYFFSDSIKITAQDEQLKAGMEFLKVSFKYLSGKYKNEYDFHAPIVLIMPQNLELSMKFSMRKKKINDIISDGFINKP